MNKKQYAVAIDGPSGAGKSTLAKAVAERLGILYVDTGAIYRTIGLYVQRCGVDPKDTPAVLALLPEVHIGMDHDADGVQRMLLNGEDVTADIRLPEISMYASARLRHPGRAGFPDGDAALAGAGAQRHYGWPRHRYGGAADADVKIFLYADVKVRAGRRALELEQRGTPKPYEEVLREMEERDYNDTHRAAAPLRAADDAIMIDTSDMDFDASRELLLDVIRGSVSN